MSKVDTVNNIHSNYWADFSRAINLLFYKLSQKTNCNNELHKKSFYTNASNIHCVPKLAAPCFKHT